MNPRIAALVEEAKRKHAALIEARKQQANVLAIPAPAANSINNITVNEDEVNSNIVHHLSTTATHAQTTKLDFNKEQLDAIELALQAKSFCLIGAAGTGKTTVTQEIIARLQRASHVLPLSESTKHLDQGAPGIVICGFTNKAVNNIRKKLPPHLQKHCMTIHKLLEFQPNYYEIIDDEGQMKTTMLFEPARNQANPLPHISTIIFEESSMIGTDLYGQVIAALPRASKTQIIFLGDLNQIPPVFGPSILGFKLAELQTVELTHVYRQALQSPIISLATALRVNDSANLPKPLLEKTSVDREEHGNITIHPWKKRVDKDHAIAFMKLFLPKMIDSGTYDPEQDMILCPFNKSFGTIELNKIIADHLAKQRGSIVYEVIARYNKSYFAVGDRVLVDRHEAIITKIEKTIGYGGKLPQEESIDLDRWGVNSKNPAPKELTADEILNALDSLAGSDEESKNLASHNITVYIPDLDVEKTLSSAGDINSMIFGYCLTIHKSQGSEWQKVFLFLHNSHATMLSRELVYTAVTRAKHSLYIICEGDSDKRYANSILRAAERPIIPGTTLSDKIEYFRGKKAEMLIEG